MNRLFYQHIMCGLILCLTPLSLVAGTQTVFIEPAAAGFGQASEIKLTIPKWQADDSLTLRPGGPFLLDEIAFNSPPKLIAKLNDTTYTVIDNKKVVAIKWQPSPKIVGSYDADGDITHLLTDQKQLIIAVKNQGLRWLDVSNPAQINKIAARPLNANMINISTHQDYVAALVSPNEIQIIKTYSTGDHKITSKLRHTLHLSQSISNLLLKKDRLFLLGRDSGLAIFDFTEKQQPTLRGIFQASGEAESLTVEDNYAYLANGSGGLVVLDITDPSHITWLGSHSKLGAITGAWIHQDRAIVNNNGSRLASLSITNPALPITGSYFKPQKGIQSMTVDGNDVLIVTGNKIQRIDFNHDTDIQISNEGINQGGSRRAFVQDGIAYVADWFSGLHIYDMRNPRLPRHIGNYHTPGSSKGVVVDDGIAYIGDDDHGLQIVDVHDPHAPKKISEVMTSGLAYTLKLIDHRVYLADHRGGFDIIDVKDIQHPKVIGSFDTPGKSWAIDVRGNTVYVADDLSGLLIFNISNPKKPVQIGQFKPGGYAEDLAIRDNLAFVTFFDSGLYILDISQPASPLEISHLAIPGNARSITLKGDLAYIAGWESGLQVVDISNTLKPQLIGNYDTNGSTWGLDIEGHYAYLWDWWGGIKVVDIQQPRSPSLLGLYQGRNIIQAMSKQGNYALAASGDSGLQIYDITNPLNPIWMNGMEFDSFVRAVDSTDTQAWLTLDDNDVNKTGLISIDISDPFAIKLTGQLHLTGVHPTIKQDSGYLYIANQSNGVSVVDARNPSDMRLLETLDVNVNRLLINQQQLLLSTDHGILAYSVAEAGKPKQLSISEKGTSFTHLAAEDDLLVAVEPGKALHLYRTDLPNSGKAPLTALNSFVFTEPVSDIQISGQLIYVYSQAIGMTVLQINPQHTITSRTVYPASGDHRQMLLHNGSVLFSGETTISSLTPFTSEPLLKQAIVGNTYTQSQSQTFKVPAKLPLGTYHLELKQANGNTFLYPNALHVELKKSNKPKLSQEDFKKLLEQHLGKTKVAQ